MANKKPAIDPNKPLPTNASIDDQVNYWSARVAEVGTGTRGRLAKQSLHLALQAQAVEQKAKDAANPVLNGTGGGTTVPQDYAAQNRADAFVSPEVTNQVPVVTPPKVVTPKVTPLKVVVPPKNLPPAASKAVTQAQAFQNFKDAYPQEAALIASDPGLTQVFNQAMSAPGGAWAVPKFQAAYEQSAYYQNHAPSYMSAEQARVGDHAGYVDAYNNMYKDVVSWARDAGIQLDPSVLGGALPTTNLQKGVSTAHAYDPKNPTLIDDLLHKYWDSGAQHQADITRYLATKQSLNPTGGYQAIGGQEFTDAQNLKAYYASMGQNPASVNGKINPNDPTGDIYFANLAHSIAAGTTTAQGEQDKALTSAKAMFPTYASALNDGSATVQSLASPYINSLSSLLETNPNGIDLSQSSGDAQKIKNAMGAGLGQTPMSLTDFETSVRQDPRWGQTLNAQNSVESIGHKILTDFGVTS
jgi:hypothetical protein